MIRGCLCVLLMFLSLGARAQDYEREARWAREIVPGVVVGDAVWLPGPGSRPFLGLLAESAHPKALVLLVHGIGVHPDHGVIGALRAALADQGYTTLSIQMPVLDAAAPPSAYRELFPNAIERIRAAATWLRGKDAAPIVLVSHSLGSAMAGAFYEQTADAPFSSWVCMGLSGAYGSMRNVKVPILDVYGENDLPSVLRGDWRRRITVDSIPGSRQLKVSRADHFYSGREQALAGEIDSFLDARLRK